MKDFQGKVAVITGGASGVGLGMARRFADEKMSVVLADVEEPALDRAVKDLRSNGAQAKGRVVDVSDWEAVASFADACYDSYGAIHVLCLNAGVGSGAAGHMWDYDLNDWRWAMEVNVWGVIHGINAFVPRMVGQPEGHVILTSSGNGGIAPISSTPIYALTKAAVVVLAECLYGQLQSVGSAVRASVLFPGPKMLRTGLWTSGRNRPARLAKQRPSSVAQPTSIEEWENQMRAAGIEPDYTPVELVGDLVVEALRCDKFWILPESEDTDRRIRARADSMLERRDPDYLAPFLRAKDNG